MGWGAVGAPADGAGPLRASRTAPSSRATRDAIPCSVLQRRDRGDAISGPDRPARVSRLAGIDTLRGLAAAAVFVCHLGQFWPFLALPRLLDGVITWGSHGVDIFIVVSGFCLMMAVLAADGRLDVGQFSGRRAWRILPAYWVALAFASVLALIPVTAALTVSEPASWGDVAIHAVGMQTWVPATLGTINGSLWSVSLEIQLYIVFPLLIAVWRRRGMLSVVIASAVLAVVWELLNLTTGWLYTGDWFVMPMRLIQFVIGMGVAVMIVRGRAPRGIVGFAVAAVAIPIGCVLYTLHAEPLLQHVVWAIGGAGLILWLNGMGLEGRVAAPLEWFGARSYSFYLLHQPMILLAAPLVVLLPGGWPVQLAVGGTLCFAVTLLGAAGLFRGVELPSHRAGRRRFPAATPHAPEATLDPKLAPAS